MLKKNDFSIDLSKATIYKYTIKFSVEETSTKIKKFLASARANASSMAVTLRSCFQT